MLPVGANGQPLSFAWSPDNRYAVVGVPGSRLEILDLTTHLSQCICSQNDLENRDPDWSPDGTKIAFTSPDSTTESHIHTVNADRSGDTELTSAVPPFQDGPSWAPDGSRIAFAEHTGDSEAGIYTMRADGSDVTPVPGTGTDSDPAWSPDGSMLAVRHFITGMGSEIDVVDPVTGDHTPITSPTGDTGPPAWGPDLGPPPPAYARPRGATPMVIPLVPSYLPCDAPNSQHGGPLAFDSCAPPQPQGSPLTTGTPEANGQGAHFIGSVTLRTIVGDSSTPQNDADVAIAVSVSDVRCTAAGNHCAGALSDYTGELGLLLSPRITDRSNSIFGENGTVSDFSRFWAHVPCAGTPDPSVGSTCQMQTTVNAGLPGAIVEGKRAIWELDRVELWDGDDTGVFASQGSSSPILIARRRRRPARRS